MKIVKSIISNPLWGYGVDIDTPYLQPHVYINAQPEQLEIKLYVIHDGAEKVLLWHKLDIATLKSLNGFVDHTVWTVYDTVRVLYDEEGAIPSDIYSDQLVDVFSKTLSSRSTSTGYDSGYSKTPYSIYANNSNGNFSDFTLVIKMNSTDEFIFEGPSASSVTNQVIPFARSLLPNITLNSDQSTVGVDSSITVNVTSDSSVKEVYLEQVYGMLNKVRVPLTNGSGSFELLTTGLAAGDVARVKAGFRKFPGVTDFSITVS